MGQALPSTCPRVESNETAKPDSGPEKKRGEAAGQVSGFVSHLGAGLGRALMKGEGITLISLNILSATDRASGA